MGIRKWIRICIYGGALVIISSIVGFALIGEVFKVISGLVDPNIKLVLEVILSVGSFIATSGGIMVIIGALITRFSSDIHGRFVLRLGIGTSLVGLLILITTFIMSGAISDLNLVPEVEDHDDYFDEFYFYSFLPSIFIATYNGSLGLLGVIISLFARKQLRKLTIMIEESGENDFTGEPRKKQFIPLRIKSTEDLDSKSHFSITSWIIIDWIFILSILTGILFFVLSL